MKKLMAFTLAAMMLVGAFAGCSSKDNGEGASGWVNDYFGTFPTLLNPCVSTSSEDGMIIEAYEATEVATLITENGYVQNPDGSYTVIPGTTTLVVTGII